MEAATSHIVLATDLHCFSMDTSPCVQVQIISYLCFVGRVYLCFKDLEQDHFLVWCHHEASTIATIVQSRTL